MFTCNRGEMVDLGAGYSLLLLHADQNHHTYTHALPSPHSRSFELPGDSLHYAPDRPAGMRHVKLDISLDFEQETISGIASTTFSTLYEAIRTISFDAEELQIEQVTLENGPQLSFSNTGKQLIVTLDRVYTYGETFTIAVKYHAKPRTGLNFVKPAPEDPTRPVQAWTFGQPRYHSHWFPCHDSPDDRATIEIIATVPAQFITIANGNLLHVTDNGATRTHHWRLDVPQAVYLFSLVVGDFALIEDSYNGKPVNYYIRKDRKDDAPLYFSKTPQMMRFFSEFTGVEYPYDNYKQTVVELYTGAMEHTTATTHSFTLVADQKAALDIDLVPVVAHELAHQWFGDLLTCRDWSNAWLNEGFATYFEQMWEEHDLGVDEFKYSMLQEKQGYLAEDKVYRRPIVYYVYHDRGFELFDRHLYNKGAWVLHMLRHLLGTEGFRRSIHAYVERYRERQVVTADLLRVLEETSGHSLERFFQQWVHGGGHPELEVNYTWDAERKLAKVRIKQTQKVDELTACFYTPLDLAFTIPASDETPPDAKTVATRNVPMQVLLGEYGQNEQNFYLSLEREPLMLRIDPDGWLLKTLSFERSTQTLSYQLAHDPDVLGRVEAAQELGKHSEDASIVALTTALNGDAFWGVRVTAAQALAKIASERTQEILLDALRTLDATQFSKVRNAIVTALGDFQAPQQAELAQRSAQALATIVEQGDVSYLVEQNSAESLGRTRIQQRAGTTTIDFLLAQIARPSWMYVVQSGVFRGLGATGEDRVVDLISAYVLAANNSPLLRRSAIYGLLAVGQHRYLYSEGARQSAVTTLSQVIAHDTWEPNRATAARALLALGEKRVISQLQSLAQVELDSGVQRAFLVAAKGLSTGGEDDAQLKLLRHDLDEVREQNRKLREQLGAIEARLP